ncbi:type II toxin-antitoxin system mRNA interferase toxin, RelE/StbE family [Candidatus Nomurabacteria bacterium]|nr:type II toxin-antitoxin system mRNA interferase toxin, RelE/StbE family [Candidatus Kaiserbacteria bacterium]MCB9814400.1 type II toxin-antitoxin system mRNA interferase toxin, RelE/StbE family [Candidatus Nomurabacteria bacterium]
MLISYKPSFVREFKKLPVELQEEAMERIDLFKDVKNHKKLKVHKLKGRLKDFHSFSVTYSHRIVFSYESKEEIVLIAVGDHDVYK